MTPNDVLKKFIKATLICIEKKKMTRSEVAARAGLNKGYFSSILQGNKQPGFNSQVEIANALGYDYPDFLSIPDKADGEKRMVEVDSKVISDILETSRKFQNKEVARRNLDNLLTISKLDPDTYADLSGKLYGIVTRLHLGENNNSLGEYQAAEVG